MLCSRRPHLNDLILVLVLHVGVQVVRPPHRLPADAAFPLAALQRDALRLLQRKAAHANNGIRAPAYGTRLCSSMSYSKFKLN